MGVPQDETPVTVGKPGGRTALNWWKSRVGEFALQDTNWWRWTGVLLFLHVPADFATTLLAIREYGLRHETNPLLRVLLAESVWATSVFVLAATFVSMVCFAGVFSARRNADGTIQQVFTVVLKFWMGMLILVGLIVVINNVVLITAGTGW